MKMNDGVKASNETLIDIALQYPIHDMIIVYTTVTKITLKYEPSRLAKHSYLCYRAAGEYATAQK